MLVKKVNFQLTTGSTGSSERRTAGSDSITLLLTAGTLWFLDICYKENHQNTPLIHKTYTKW
jgi:hypothetical protein